MSSLIYWKEHCSSGNQRLLSLKCVQEVFTDLILRERESVCVCCTFDGNFDGSFHSQSRHLFIHLYLIWDKNFSTHISACEHQPRIFERVSSSPQSFNHCNQRQLTMERSRADSSSSESSSDGTAISGVPIGMRRQSQNLPTPSTSRASSSKDDATNKERTPSKSVSLDFSFLDLELPAVEANLAIHVIRPELVTTLNLSGNRLEKVPIVIDLFFNLQILDVSQNLLSSLPEGLNNLTNLSTLIGSNNRLNTDSFSKDFGLAMSSCLKVLSLGGNELTCLPPQVLEMSQLRSLYLGSNRITELTKDISRLENLRVLYLGGNQLTSIPHEVGLLQNLQALSLCENRLQALPPSIARLRNLKSLGLHKNLLTALPPEIVKLRGLHELSLRGNPLVCRFVKDFTFECPSLLELAGRAAKVAKVAYSQDALPKNLVEYLETARRCVNSKCKGNQVILLSWSYDVNRLKCCWLNRSNIFYSFLFFSLTATGVYFDSRVEHIKFVDFCGVYRLPLLQYLCSPSCTSPATPALRSNSSDSDDTENDVPLNKLRRVLLGWRVSSSFHSSRLSFMILSFKTISVALLSILFSETRKFFFSTQATGMNFCDTWVMAVPKTKKNLEE